MKEIIYNLEDVETYEDLPFASDYVLVEFLREQIYTVLKNTGTNSQIIVGAFNTILAEVRKRLLELRLELEKEKNEEEI